MLGLLMVLDVVLSAAQLLGGIMLMAFVSSRPDNMIGWKTARGSSSRQARKYANKTGGKLWVIAGTPELVMSLALPAFLNSRVGTAAAGLAAAAVLIIILTSFALSFAVVESRLKKYFPE